MIDAKKVRTQVLAETAFYPSNLPPSLRNAKQQELYIDAVVQGVILSRHCEDDATASRWVETVAGLLLIDGSFNPQDQRFYAHLQNVMAELNASAIESSKVKIDGKKAAMFAPDAKTTQRFAVYSTTFDILQRIVAAGDKIFLQSYAHTGRRVANRYQEHEGKPNVMQPMIRSAYDSHISDLGSGGTGGGGLANVELPPLNDPAGYNDEIEPDNVRAVSTIYVTYQLEFGLKAAARILELFVAGLLPISASDGSARELDTLYWDQDDLLDEASRRSVYSRVLGAPGGEMAFDIQPNTEFNTLLMRVVSAVSEFEREQSALSYFDNAARGRRFRSTSPEFVRKAIRDFAANVSLRGWAGTAFTAERMANQVRRVMRILNLPAVRNAFGVTTPWQVIERVSQREFGITVNTVLHRTLAAETQTIMKIIADHHTVWSSSSSVKAMLFAMDKADDNLAEIDNATTQRLLIACQHFRAVAGVGEALLDEYTSPEPTPSQPSLPDMTGFGAKNGGMPGIDMGGITQLRQMVSSGQTPSLEQLRSMLPGF